MTRTAPQQTGSRPQSQLHHAAGRAVDQALSGLETALRTLSGAVAAARATPRPGSGGGLAPHAALHEAQRRQSAALMRVNHVGEVCAQALYQAQALTARS
ncbi:MAG: demethoxyubiquinone hydroxylase family protein, partial [Rubrivivax sp.]